MLELADGLGGRRSLPPTRLGLDGMVATRVVGGVFSYLNSMSIRYLRVAKAG